jgi:hypothetical protein
VAAALVHMDVELWRVGRPGTGYVLGIETHLDTLAVDLVGIDMFPAGSAAGFLDRIVAAPLGSLVAVGSGNGMEMEMGLLGIPEVAALDSPEVAALDSPEAAALEILRTGNRPGVVNYFGDLARYFAMIHVDPLLLVIWQPVLHHSPFAAVHIGPADGGDGAT